MTLHADELNESEKSSRHHDDRTTSATRVQDDVIASNITESSYGNRTSGDVIKPSENTVGGRDAGELPLLSQSGVFTSSNIACIAIWLIVTAVVLALIFCDGDGRFCTKERVKTSVCTNAAESTESVINREGQGCQCRRVLWKCSKKSQQKIGDYTLYMPVFSVVLHVVT